jgi:hypothetical protein
MFLQLCNFFSNLFPKVMIFFGQPVHNDRDPGKNKQRNGPIVTMTVAPLQGRTVPWLPLLPGFQFPMTAYWDKPQ